MKTMKGKRVLITGGASGIGFCTAEEFARKEAELVLVDINAQALEEAAGKLRGRAACVHTYPLDVTNWEAVGRMAENVLDRLGPVDILINNAGIGHQGEMAETSLAQWKKLMDVNFWGPLYHVYAFLPSMIDARNGQIVNVSSGQAFFRLPTWGAYAAVKAALGVFSEVLHFELRKHNIRVTTIYPFMVNTTFYDEVNQETWGAKLSMKLLPYYSMKPEKVGRIVFNAVARKKKVEMVSIINDVGSYAHCVPFASDLIAMTSNFLLSKRT